MGRDVLVLDGETRTALAVTRSLGRRGVPVTVGASSHKSLAGSSGFCRSRLVYPNPSESPEEFMDWLRNTLQDERFELLMPLTDITTVLMAGISGDISGQVRLICPSVDSLARVLDKGQLIGEASNAGVPVPHTLDLMSRKTDVLSLVREYPVVVKTRKSFDRRDNGWVNGVVRVAKNAEELQSIIEGVDAVMAGPLVQEFIPGWGEGLFVLCRHGEIRAVFAHKRIRETPPSGGVSTLRESVSADQNILKSVAALIEKLKWHGPAMFEFRVDKRDRSMKLMEVNPRLWGSLHLAIVSGVDFPWLMYRMAIDGDVEPVPDYRTGVVSRWLLGDFNRLLLAAGARKNGSKTRIAELKEFVLPGKRTYFEIESFKDIGPAIFEYQSYARDSLKAISERLQIGRGK